jgi:hypothetical protein
MLYSIYTIEVNGKYYVGATRNFEKRKQTHIYNLGRLIKTGVLTFQYGTYKYFSIEELQTIGYKIRLYCYCQDAETAKIIEGRLITKYKTIGNSLNCSDKSGFTHKPHKAANKYRSLQQTYNYIKNAKL